MRVVIFALSMTFALPAAAAETGRERGQLLPIPNEPGATVRPFGDGARIERPGRPTADVHRFGDGVRIKQPDQPTVTCQPFGSAVRCK